MNERAVSTREYREMLLRDPYRPVFHFAIPDGKGIAGDPNGAFFADGLYHLMYLYENDKTGAFHWGHVSSLDLLHWRHHKDALISHEGDRGCYSGGAFLDDDKTVYLTFWKWPSVVGKDNGGIGIAWSKPPYEEFHRIEPIAVEETEWGIKDVEIDGKTVHLGCADPSNIWKNNGFYYMQLGALLPLNKYGRAENSPSEYQGDWTELYRSRDLKKWERVHRFYEKTWNGENGWPDKTEDDMCPSFLPLFDAPENGNFTGKHLQLFISHNRGCQYYIGKEEDESFHVEQHGRMAWNDFAFFAPEALIDSKKRHIMWAWLIDNLKDDYERFGWSGVFSFPRVVWLDNGVLRMAPAKELDSLEYNKRNLLPLDSDKICANNGEVFRLRAEWKADRKHRCGFRVKIDEKFGEGVEIYVDREKGTLVMDCLNAGRETKKVFEEAPIVLGKDENICMDIFVDRAVVEVYVNEKQAICRRTFATNPKDAVGIRMLDGVDFVEKLEISDIAPTNMY